MSYKDQFYDLYYWILLVWFLLLLNVFPFVITIWVSVSFKIKWGSLNHQWSIYITRVICLLLLYFNATFVDFLLCKALISRVEEKGEERGEAYPPVTVLHVITEEVSFSGLSVTYTGPSVLKRKGALEIPGTINKANFNFCAIKNMYRVYLWTFAAL